MPIIKLSYQSSSLKNRHNLEQLFFYLIYNAKELYKIIIYFILSSVLAVKIKKYLDKY